MIEFFSDWTFKESLVVIVALFTSVVVVALKFWLAERRDLFMTAKALSPADRLLLSQGKQNPKFLALPAAEQQELRKGQALQGLYDAIENTHPEQAYKDRLQFGLVKIAVWLGEVPASNVGHNGSSITSDPHHEPSNRRIAHSPDLPLFTTKSYMACLLLALSYPLLFGLLTWLVSGQWQVAGVLVAESSAWPTRVLGVFWLLELGLVMVWLLKRDLVDRGWDEKGDIIKLLLGILVMLGWGALGLWLGIPVIFVVVVVAGVAVAAGAAGAAVAGAAVAGAAVAGAAVAGAAVAVAVAAGAGAAVAVAVAAGAVAVAAGAGAAVAVAVAAVAVAAVAVAVAAVAGAAGAAGAGAVAAGAGAVAANLLVKKGFKVKSVQFEILILCVFHLVLVAYFAVAVDDITRQDDQLAALKFVILPLVLNLFPLLNALVDWLSFNITRWLLVKIYRTQHQLIMALAFAMVDIGLAVFFVFAVSAMFATAMALVNLKFGMVLDLSVIMADIQQVALLPQTWWIHAMVLTTLIPTVIHLLVVLWSLAQRPFINWWQLGLKDFWTNQWQRANLYYYHMFSRFISLLILSASLFVLYYLVKASLDPLLYWLWHMADSIIQFLDPHYKTPGYAW